MSGSVLASAFSDANKPSVAPADYMEQMRQAGQVVQGLNANRLFQANTARGQVMAQATDENGIYHPEIANRLAAGRPDAAQAMPSIVGQNQELSGQQLDQAMKRLGWIDSTAGAALTAGDYSDGAMLKMFHNGVAAGVLSLPDVQKQMATMPPDAAGRKAWLEQHQGQAATVQQQLELRYGKQITTDDGQTIRGGTQSVQTGALNMPPQPGVQKQTGPETNADLVEVSDAAGNRYKVPRGTLPGASGITTSPLGTGRPPSTLRNPSAPTATTTAPTATTGGPTDGTLTSVSPATTKEQEGAALHAVAARDLANSYQARIQPIEGALTALAGADTGKGGELLNTIRAYTQDVAPAIIQRMLPDTLTDTNKRVLFDEANKYLTGMAINAPGGAHSDAGLNAASAATPSVHISNEAARLVARAALAQQRMNQAGTLAFDRTGQPGQNYDRFMNQWNTTADPRAFVVDKMTGPERAEMVKSMGGVQSPAYQKFKQSYRDAVDGKVIIEHAGQ